MDTPPIIFRALLLAMQAVLGAVLVGVVAAILSAVGVPGAAKVGDFAQQFIKSFPPLFSVGFVVYSFWFAGKRARPRQSDSEAVRMGARQVADMTLWSFGKGEFLPGLNWQAYRRLSLGLPEAGHSREYVISQLEREGNLYDFTLYDGKAVIATVGESYCAQGRRWLVLEPGKDVALAYMTASGAVLSAEERAWGLREAVLARLGER